MYKIAVIDDDTYHLEKVSSLLSSYSQFKLAFFDNPINFIEKIRLVHFDLILLDIEMTTMNGLDVLNTLQKMQCDSLIIFITSNEQYMIDCFNKNVIGFISKKSFVNQLKPYISKAITLLSPNTIKLETIGGTIEVVESDIVLCELMLRKIYITLSNKQKIQLKYKTLDEAINLLNSDLFYQINRSTVINLNKVSKHLGNDIYLLGLTDPYPLSKYRKSDFIETYFNYMLRRD